MSQHHDPVHPDSDHLTPEILADLELGLLDDQSREHALLHLSHCSTCSLLLADVAALGHAMSELPDEPMPDAVFDQLVAALEAEPVVTPVGAATVVPIETAGRRRWGRPGIGLVAGAAGVALLGAVFLPSVMGGSNDSSNPTASNESATDDTDAQGGAATAFTATRSGTKYEEAALDAQVTELVAERPTTSQGSVVEDQVTASPTSSLSDPGDVQKSDEPLLIASDPAAAQACLEGYLGVTSVEPLAIDIGRWQGKPAAVFVLPVIDEELSTIDPNLAEVWVIDPDCSGSDEALYFYATVAR